MTHVEIFYNYIQAARQANELDTIARKLRSMAVNNLESCVNSLDKDWNGDASNEFLSRQKKLQAKLCAEAESLQKTAATIRNIAKRTYDTEMKALEISGSRTY